MDILMLVVVYLLTQIILIWPMPNWQTKVLLLVILLILVLFGFFGAPAFWPQSGGPSRLR